jgi:hypothetical protein
MSAQEQSYYFEAVLPVSQSSTIASSFSGALIPITMGNTASTMTLPVPTAGAYYDFVVGISGTANSTIEAGSSNTVIHGTIYSGLGSSGSTVLVNGNHQLRFVGGVSQPGDEILLKSDGTNWYCNCRSGAYLGITSPA